MQEPRAIVPAEPPIAFDGLLVIVGGGAVDLRLLADLHAMGAHLVGADGGGDVIADAGFQPEAIIGDLDSLRDPAAWEGKTRLRRIAEQDTIDFEKALYSTSAPVTVALGMTGKRFDHTLAALDAVTRYANKRRIILVDEEDLALVLAGPVGFEVDPGERVSVHPLAPVRFAHSEGLKYPLDGVTLAPGIRIGSSNQALRGPFNIVPEQPAPWLLILPRKYLAGLVAALLAA